MPNLESVTWRLVWPTSLENPYSIPPAPMTPFQQMQQGWHGWDAYAPFYDWENAQTVGRSDIPFWVDLAVRVGGPVLELGCGTGRVSTPRRAGAQSVS